MLIEHFRNVKEGNVLFNNALNAFYLVLYGVAHMAKDHRDSLKGNLLPPVHGLLSGYFISTMLHTG